MKTSYKVVIGNLIIAVVLTGISLMLSGGVQRGSDVALALGLVCLGLSLLNLLVCIILLITQNKEWGTGMLLSFALLLLLSGISCSEGFSGF